MSRTAIQKNILEVVKKCYLKGSNLMGDCCIVSARNLSEVAKYQPNGLVAKFCFHRNIHYVTAISSESFGENEDIGML
jgi:hypothetical protein